MLFMPKTFERYVAALRFYVHMSVLSEGLCKKHYSQLRTISIAESLCFSAEKEPVDIIRLSNSLLGAAVLILMQSGTKLAVSFSGSGVYLINSKLYTALLMTALNGQSHGDREITVSVSGGNITLKASGSGFDRHIPILTKALGGVYFRDLSSQSFVLSVPAESTDREAIKTEDEWCYITDRFSPVNIFLSEQLL